MATWILACKELGGIVYLARLPQSISASTPGIPDTTSGGPWFPVGPGLNPSVQVYNGTQWILTFTYLSHLFTRVIDDINSVWPPTTVNPVQTSGGPNPPNPIEYNIQLSTDALTLQTQSSLMLPTFAVTSFYNPPIILFPLLFLDPTTSTYSVTLSPVVGYKPNLQTPFYVGSPLATTTPYYQLYIRPYPYTGPWVLQQDWTITNPSFPWFQFVFSNIGSLRYQFSVVWGNQFNLLEPWNSAEHEGGIPGQTYVTVDSTVLQPSYQATLNDELTLDEDSEVMFGVFSPRQEFIFQAPEDMIQLSNSLLGSGSGNMFAYFGVRQAFLFEVGTDTISGYSRSKASKGGNMFGAFDVRV